VIHYTHDIPAGSVIDCDICIVGSGPAAFSLALQFVEQDDACAKRVVMLESSPAATSAPAPEGYQFSVQELYRGVVAGLLPGRQPSYLSGGRQRTYGGTIVQRHWGGWCWPNQRWNVEPNALRPESWPIPHHELMTYYRRVQQPIMQLAAFVYDDPQYWVDALQIPGLETMPLGDDGPLRTRMMQVNPIEVQTLYGPVIEASKHVHLYRNANALRYGASVTADGRKRVNELEVRAVESGKPGREVTVRSSYFVVAAGGIESTRLLLLSDIGNGSDHLGRYFMDHPFQWVAGTFDMTSCIPAGVRDFYFNPNFLPVPGHRSSIIPTLVPTVEFMEKQGIGDFRVLLGGQADIPGTINTSFEPMPCRDSTVSLASPTEMAPDLFGQRRVKVDWRASEIDARTARVCMEVARDTLERLGYATNVELPDMTRSPWSWQDLGQIMGSWHPMGTTRMSHDPADGVVDANLRVHDATNLYVASSSTFPTGNGYENVTFTVCSLSVRLGDHLKTDPPC
jgi:hypothetical protein